MSARASVAVPVATVWTSPEAPREVDAPALADRPDPDAWNAALADAPPNALHGRTLTQALYGEPVVVLDEAGDWTQVALPWQPSSADATGYPGWVRTAHLAAPVEATGASVALLAPVGSAVGSLSFGTVLPLVDTDADRVVTSGGLVLPVATTRPVRSPGSAHSADVPDPPIRRAAVLTLARERLLGRRYLWGGTSGWGVDCSGLVHLVLRAHGVTVARDAFDQAATLEPVGLDAAGPGDLWFFARPGRRVHHVGLVTSEAGTTRRLLHAPDSGPSEHVVDEPMRPERERTLVSAARVGPTS